LKPHQIAIDQAGKRLGQLAASRLPVLYDEGLKRLKNPDPLQSIQQSVPFKMHVAEVEIHEARAIRVTDVEYGYYVKLTQPAKTAEPLLEIGYLISVEEVVHGQSNIKAW
jgi:hypothetical protein